MFLPTISSPVLRRKTIKKYIS